MTQYEVEKKDHSVILTEHQHGDDYTSDNPELKTFYAFSDAVEALDDCLTGDELFYSSCTDDKIKIIATQKGHESELSGYDGPYENTRLAYGVQHVARLVRQQESIPLNLADQVSPGAKLHYEYTVFVENFEYCRLKTAHYNIPINIFPLSNTENLRADETVFVRVIGETDDVCVFNTPDELTVYSHLPPQVLIPIGTYHSEIPEQDSSVVLTGRISRASLMSDQAPRRYSLTVQTLDMEVELDVLTNYEIMEGSFILAKAKLSSVFPA